MGRLDILQCTFFFKSVRSCLVADVLCLVTVDLHGGFKGTGLGGRPIQMREGEEGRRQAVLYFVYNA